MNLLIRAAKVIILRHEQLGIPFCSYEKSGQFSLNNLILRAFQKPKPVKC